jgi:hypothetical protein
MFRTRNTVREHARLRLGEEGWNLTTASTTETISRTRYGGSGRPNLLRQSLSSSDSDYESEEESSLEGESGDDSDDDSTDSMGLEDVEEDDKNKPTSDRLFLEFESLKKCMEKNCRCPVCNGPVEMKVKTVCLASNVMVSCIDKDCGYVDVSESSQQLHRLEGLMIGKGVPTLQSTFFMSSDFFRSDQVELKLPGCLAF